MILRRGDIVGDGWVVARIENRGIEYYSSGPYIVDLIVLQRGNERRHWVRMGAL